MIVTIFFNQTELTNKYKHVIVFNLLRNDDALHSKTNFSIFFISTKEQTE